MLKSFWIKQKVKSTYDFNFFLYYLRKLPIFKKIIKDKYFNNKILKKVIFLIKYPFAYIYPLLIRLILIIPLSYLSKEIIKSSDSFYYFYFISSLLSIYLFNKIDYLDNFDILLIDKLNYDPKPIILNKYLSEITKTFIFSIPCYILLKFNIFKDFSINNFFLMHINLIFIQTLGTFLILSYYKKYNEKIFKPIYALIFLVINIFLFSLPFYTKVYLIGPFFINNIYLILISLITVLFVIYIFKYDNYNAFVRENILEYNELTNIIKKGNNFTTTNFDKNIDDLVSFNNTNKEGADFLNYIFYERHKKYFFKKVRFRFFFSLGFLLILLLVAFFVTRNKEFTLNNYITFQLVNLLFFSLASIGSKYSEACFINCDKALLQYRFYREKKVILKTYYHRLSKIFLLNIPILITLLLFNIFYAFIINLESYLYISLITIFISYIFYSLFHLNIYYLLQPYNKDGEIVSLTYNFLITINYSLIYILPKIKNFIFNLVLYSFIILLAIISLIIIQFKSHKTFKLRD